jgi:hypothetical protein
MSMGSLAGMGKARVGPVRGRSSSNDEYRMTNHERMTKFQARMDFNESLKKIIALGPLSSSRDLLSCVI